MPFTIGGEWVPSSSPATNKPVKIIKEKRKNSWVTRIKNLSLNESQLKSLCSTLKQRLGCGGSIKENEIELQGDQIQATTTFLKEMNIKIS